MELSADFVKQYTGNVRKRHPKYDETVKIANRLKPHATGDIDALADHLLKERRPSEMPETFAYRKKIAVRKTKGTVDKIFNCLCKIRKSPDWNIKYDAEYYNSKPKLKEFNLNKYCEELLPRHQSITNWVFNYQLKVAMYDPNAVVIIGIEALGDTELDFVKPIPITFESCDVFDYSDKLFVGKSTEKSTYNFGKSQRTDGDVIWVLTPTEIYKYSQINVKGEFEITIYYNHNIGKLPCWKIGGQLIDEQNMIYESMFDAMQPYLDEAFREYSDLQAEVLNHVHSIQWAYESQQCPTCKGQGKMIVKGKGTVVCSDCNGGKISTSPLKRIVISPPEPGQPAAPAPPMGYVQKDTAIVELQDRRIRNHEYDALACFNMEYLAKTPQVESGVAKTLDREELTTFVNMIAEQLVQGMDLAYYYINEYLFNVMIPDSKEREKQLPEIAVPTIFDLLNSQYYLDELQKATTAKVNPVVLKELQLEYAQKKFYDDDTYEELELVYKLDPCGALSTEEKTVYSAQRFVSDFDLIKSANIYEFVKRAINANKEFDHLTYDEQVVIIDKITDDYIAEMNVTVNAIANDNLNASGGG
jgi:hypothetical protein